MKKVFVSVMLMIVINAFIISCGLIDVDEYERFNLNEETVAKIGERLFLNDFVYVYLDKIIQDTRVPDSIVTDQAQYVALEFTVGEVDTNGRVQWTEQLEFHTDTLNSRAFLVPFIGTGGGRQYILTVVDVDPRPAVLSECIPNENYEITFVLEAGEIAHKPNIYLYPKTMTKMDVSLAFPQGGHVTVSDPQYPDEWQHIKVSPNGKIDGKHDFLFYEAALPDVWQMEEGWAVKQAGLKTFFEDNLKDYGFNMREIADFTNYWIPRLQASPYYAIYPQHTEKINDVVELHISKTPRSLLRFFYVIKEIPEFEDIAIPEIPEFERKGFTVTEWGVILK